MKMLIIFYSEVADEAVLSTLKKAGVKAYTKTHEAYGEGSETEPKAWHPLLAGSKQYFIHCC